MYALALRKDYFLSACGSFAVSELESAKFFGSEDAAYAHQSTLNDVWRDKAFAREVLEDEKPYLRTRMNRKRREVAELERFLK